MLEQAEDAEKRQIAAYTLGLLHDERAIKPLVNALENQDEDPKVRGDAAEALAYLTKWLDKEDVQASVVGALLDSLKDPAVEVRFWSAFALGELGVKQAVPALKQLAASDESVLQGWWSVSKEASDAIRQIQDLAGTEG
jgi:HEAT repeat protein